MIWQCCHGLSAPAALESILSTFPSSCKTLFEQSELSRPSHQINNAFSLLVSNFEMHVLSALHFVLIFSLNLILSGLQWHAHLVTLLLEGARIYFFERNYSNSQKHSLKFSQKINFSYTMISPLLLSINFQ